MAKTEVIEIKPLNIKTATIKIAGDGDLILNKMNDVSAKDLIDKRKDKAKDTAKPNQWEAIITSMHWQAKRLFGRRTITGIKRKRTMYYRVRSEKIFRTGCYT